MVVVGRPGYRIVCRTIKGGSQVSSLIVSFVESSNHCILASSLLVLVWFFSLWYLELMVIFMTSSSSSIMELTCFFYDVLDVGVFAGSSFIEVSHLYIIGIFLPPLLTITNKLEFAQFGAHWQKLWQFWFFLEVYLFSWKWHKEGASGSTAAPERQYRWKP